jgi:hypothetical protein
MNLTKLEMRQGSLLSRILILLTKFRTWSERGLKELISIFHKLWVALVNRMLKESAFLSVFSEDLFRISINMTMALNQKVLYKVIISVV